VALGRKEGDFDGADGVIVGDCDGVKGVALVGDFEGDTVLGTMALILV
jgi:hypothetical protein